MVVAGGCTQFNSPWERDGGGILGGFATGERWKRNLGSPIRLPPRRSPSPPPRPRPAPTPAPPPPPQVVYVSVPATKSAAERELERKKDADAAALKERVKQLEKEADLKAKKTEEDKERMRKKFQAELMEKDKKLANEKERARTEEKERKQEMDKIVNEFQKEYKRMNDQLLDQEQRHGRDMAGEAEKRENTRKELTEQMFQAEKVFTDRILAAAKGYADSMAQAFEILANIPRFIAMDKEAERLATVAAYIRDTTSGLRSSLLQLTDQVRQGAENAQRKAEAETMHRLCFKGSQHFVDLLNLLDKSMHINDDVKQYVRTTVLEAKNCSTSLSDILRRIRYKEHLINSKDLEELEGCIEAFEKHIEAIPAFQGKSTSEKAMDAIRSLSADDNNRFMSIRMVTERSGLTQRLSAYGTKTALHNPPSVSQKKEENTRMVTLLLLVFCLCLICILFLIPNRT